ncbi:putative disease resistance protein-like [Capsicum annuum]|nr:putative disease resistance protein-like [Capsicum annuum]
MEKLTKFRADIKVEVEKAEGEGYKPKPNVVKWLMMFMSSRINGKLRKEPLQRQRSLCINVAQVAVFVCIVGVLGTGGVGKTTLVKNLNNELLKANVSSSKQSFGVVFWVTVPKLPIEIRNVQGQIASRLDLEIDNNGSVERTAGKINARIKQENSFFLILDDVWDVINLNDVGGPQPVVPARSKVIINTRSLEVCRQMRTDIEMNVTTLKEEEL